MPICGEQPTIQIQPDPDKGGFWTIRCCRIEDFDAWNENKELLIANWNQRSHETNVEAFIEYIDQFANLISNMKKPRSDNNYGRAAQKFEDALAYYREQCEPPIIQ